MDFLPATFVNLSAEPRTLTLSSGASIGPDACWHRGCYADQGGGIGLRVCRSGPHDPRIPDALHTTPAALRAPAARRHRFFQEIAFFLQDARFALQYSAEDFEGLRPLNEVSKAKRRMP